MQVPEQPSILKTRAKHKDHSKILHGMSKDPN